MEIVGAELRDLANDVPNVKKPECLTLHFTNAVGNARERLSSTTLQDGSLFAIDARWGMRGRGFSSTTIQDGPLFAIDGPCISHGPSFLLTDRYLWLTVRTVSYGTSFLLTVRIQSVHLIITPEPTIDGPYVSYSLSALLTDHFCD